MFYLDIKVSNFKNKKLFMNWYKYKGNEFKSCHRMRILGFLKSLQVHFLV